MHHRLRPILLALLALALGASPALAAPRPNDQYFSYQWAFGPAKKYGMDVLRAWDFSRGKGVVVAVIDSGFIGSRYYPDFGARILPGYDFISDPADARDGDGRDGDPTDPGNWCDEDEFEPSDWHGTVVASVIGATADNRIATAGVAPQVSIIFVRVLGACNLGDTDDTSDAILWAAGLPVPGTPLNEHPARIINMSLGSYSSSSCFEQDAINQATLAGSIVVVSAMNNNQLADDRALTNCDNTISVAATDGRGLKSPYSNFGEKVDIAAPTNGEDGCKDDPAVTPYFDTKREPIAYSKRFYGCYSGTSFAAPLVSGALALAASYDPTTSSDDLITLLLDTVTPFPPITTRSNSCYSPNACGAGIVSAGKLLVAMSKRPMPSMLLNSETTLTVGASLAVDFTASNSSEEPILNAAGVLSSLTPETCSVGEWQVTALTIGDCNIVVDLNGTAQTAPRSFIFPLKHDRVSIVADIGYVPTMSSKAKQEIISRAYTDLSSLKSLVDSWTLKSLTPKVCKVRYAKSIGYDLVGVKQGRCDLRAFFEASEGSEDEVALFSIAVE